MHGGVDRRVPGGVGEPRGRTAVNDVDVLFQSDFWTAFGTMGTFVVVTISAVAALAQLRHVRNANELQALLSVQRDFQSTELQEALHYVQLELQDRMQEPDYRAELERIGFIDPRKHPEMIACNWFNQVGALLENEMVAEGAFLDLFGRLIDHYWGLLEPTVAVLRRKRGRGQYEGFEYLAMRARHRRERYKDGHYPKDAPRLEVRDAYLEEDSAAEAPAP